MIGYEKLWKPHPIKKEQTLELGLGSLHLWIHRDLQEWQIAYENDKETGERFFFSIADEADPADHDWTRWILDDGIQSVHFRPQLPDRPLIVRPEMPVCLMPKQSVQFFVGIPIWLAITFGSRHEKAIEVPSMTLSNSWFGQLSEGELCYAVKTTAKLHQESLLPSMQHVIFPIEIRNLSNENLKFERLCLRPQYLNIFQGKTRLWTSKGRVSYRGEDSWSRIVYSSKAPEFDDAKQLLGQARETMKRGALLKTFDTLKQRAEIS